MLANLLHGGGKWSEALLQRPRSRLRECSGGGCAFLPWGWASCAGSATSQEHQPQKYRVYDQVSIRSPHRYLLKSRVGGFPSSRQSVRPANTRPAPRTPSATLARKMPLARMSFRSTVLSIDLFPLSGCMLNSCLCRCFNLPPFVGFSLSLWGALSGPHPPKSKRDVMPL